MKSWQLKADSVKSLTRIKLILEAFKKQVKLIYVSYNGNTFRSENKTKQNKNHNCSNFSAINTAL